MIDSLQRYILPPFHWTGTYCRSKTGTSDTARLLDGNAQRCQDKYIGSGCNRGTTPAEGLLAAICERQASPQSAQLRCSHLMPSGPAQSPAHLCSLMTSKGSPRSPNPSTTTSSLLKGYSHNRPTEHPSSPASSPSAGCSASYRSASSTIGVSSRTSIQSRRNGR